MSDTTDQAWKRIYCRLTLGI